MQTKLLDATGPDWQAAAQQAGQILRAGGLVALPTETVYGLGANALDEEAVARIFAVKGRPQDNPLIVHIARLEELKGLVQEIPPQALKLARAFWPGPLTIIFPKSSRIPARTTAGRADVGIRMPSHPVAREIIRQAGVPVAAPSANLSGKPSPTSAAHCVHDLMGRVEAIVDGGDCAVGIESTVLSLAGGRPVVLRPGGISPGQIGQVLGGPVEVAYAVTHPLPPGQAPASPGMKYRHYSPEAKVILVRGGREGFCRFFAARQGPDVWALAFEEDCPQLPAGRVLTYGRAGDPASQARGLFDALRRLDELGARVVYAHSPDLSGEGLGVYNRMLRAAGFEEVVL